MSHDVSEEERVDRRSLLGLGAAMSVGRIETPFAATPVDVGPTEASIVRDTSALERTHGRAGNVVLTKSYDAALAPGLGGARYVLTLSSREKSGASRWIFESPHQGLVWQLAEPRPEPEMFGAVGDGATDDSAALLAGLKYLAQVFEGGELLLGPRQYRTRTLSLPKAVGIVGSSGGFAPHYPATLTASVHALLLDEGATIMMHEASTLQGVVLRPYGMAFPQKQVQILQWSGTAITIAPESAGVHIGRCLIVGFAQAILASGEGPVFRTRIEDTSIDCLNGISLSVVPDVAYLTRIHAWNFATTGAGERNVTARPGVAFRLAHRADWAKITDCFCYGYEIGFELDDVADCTLTGCGADHKPGRPGSASSIGFKLHGRARNNRLIGCQAAAQGRGIYLATNATEPRLTNHVQGGTVWDNAVGLEISGGHAMISDLAVRVRGGVLIGPASAGGRLDGLSFEGIAAPQVDGDAAAMRRFSITAPTIIG